MINDKKSNRFYSGLCEPFLGEPTKNQLMILSDKKTGEGLAARKNFSKGDLVFKFYGQTLSEQTLYTLQKSPGVYVEDPIVMGKVLHSCSPNMLCNMNTQSFVALRDIKPGEYLTMDYNSTEDILFRSFNCECGSVNCQGEIKGRLFITPEKLAV